MSCHHCFVDNSSISKAIVVELYANSSSPEQLEVALVAECPLGRGYETLQLEAHRIDIVGHGQEVMGIQGYGRPNVNPQDISIKGLL